MKIIDIYVFKGNGTRLRRIRLDTICNFSYAVIVSRII